MRKSKFTESQIVAILAEGDAGLPVGEVCRKHGISNALYYQLLKKGLGCLLLLDALVERSGDVGLDGLQQDLTGPAGHLAAHQDPDLVQGLPLAVQC